jgi:cytochrome c-type biogenesis protein CcmH/NrfG
MTACTTPQMLLLSLLPDGLFIVPLASLQRVENLDRKRLAELEKREDWPAVMEFADTKIKENPNSGEWYYVRGTAEIRRGQWRTARATFTESVRLAPNDLPSWHMLARAQGETGEQDVAIRTLERALDIDRSDAQTHFFLGEIHRRGARPALAVSAYREAVRLRPEFAEALFGLALVQQASGDPDAAKTTMTTLERVNAELARKAAARL